MDDPWGAPEKRAQESGLGPSASSPEAQPGLNQPGYHESGLNQPGLNQPGYGPPGYQQPGYQQPGYQQAPYGYAAGPTPQTEQNAIFALVSSILAWVLCPLIPAVVALVLSGQAKRAIDSSGGLKTGSGLVQAARIISWIHLGFVGVIILILVAAIAIPVAIDAG